MSLDGYSSGPGGPDHDTWLHDRAMHPQTAEYFEGIWRGADTVLLGRTNYEGFYSVWPAITRDANTDPRTRELGRWLDSVEKVVVSRISRDLAAEVKALRAKPGRDVLVANSASVIGELLRLDLIDDLRLFMVPVLVGGGLRLFPDGVDAAFATAGVTALSNGVVGLHFTRP